MVILVIGWSATFSPSLNVPLPAELGELGFPGCFLYSSADAATVSFMLDPNGDYDYTLPVPNRLKFCGASLVFQTLMLGPASTPGNAELLVSNGLQCLGGN